MEDKNKPDPTVTGTRPGKQGIACRKRDLLPHRACATGRCNEREGDLPSHSVH